MRGMPDVPDPDEKPGWADRPELRERLIEMLDEDDGHAANESGHDS